MTIEVANNFKNLMALTDINPDMFTYTDLKMHSKLNGIELNEIDSALNISRSTRRTHAKKNNGVLGSKYFYILTGMIAIRMQSKVKIVD